MPALEFQQHLLKQCHVVSVLATQLEETGNALSAMVVRFGAIHRFEDAKVAHFLHG